MMLMPEEPGGGVLEQEKYIVKQAKKSRYSPPALLRKNTEKPSIANKKFS